MRKLAAITTGLIAIVCATPVIAQSGAWQAAALPDSSASAEFPCEPEITEATDNVPEAFAYCEYDGRIFVLAHRIGDPESQNAYRAADFDGMVGEAEASGRIGSIRRFQIDGFDAALLDGERDGKVGAFLLVRLSAGSVILASVADSSVLFDDAPPAHATKDETDRFISSVRVLGS